MTSPTFEQMMAEIELIVRQLEEGALGLDDSLKQYEKGVSLLRNCHKQLDAAQRKIEILSGIDANGNAITQPMEDAQLSAEQKLESRSSRRGYKKTAAKSETAESPASANEDGEDGVSESRGLFDAD